MFWVLLTVRIHARGVRGVGPHTSVKHVVLSLHSRLPVAVVACGPSNQLRDPSRDPFDGQEPHAVRGTISIKNVAIDNGHTSRET